MSFVSPSMKSTIFAVAAILAAGANALVGRSNVCCFHLSASGVVSGTLGQLDDGQIRILGPLPPSEFCIDTRGGIVDQSGYGCVVTREYYFDLPRLDHDLVANSMAIMLQLTLPNSNVISTGRRSRVSLSLQRVLWPTMARRTLRPVLQGSQENWKSTMSTLPKRPRLRNVRKSS